MNKFTKLGLLATSAILSLSVLTACPPVAVEVPPSTNATPTATTPPTDTTATPATTPPTDTTATATATPATTPPTNTTTPPTNTTTPPTTVATATPVATATAIPSPTGTATTLTNNSGGGGSSSGGGGSAGVIPTITSMSRTAAGATGIMGDTIALTGTNFATGTATVRFYVGPTYQSTPSRFLDKSVTVTASSTTNATATVPDLTDAEVNDILGRAAGTTVTATDRNSLIANVLVAGTGGTAQSGAIGAGGF